MTPPRRIGLFGGTFDPVHLGHLEIARRSVEALDLDEVRFLPCRISPHKTSTPPASGEDRVAMLELAVRELPWAVVDDFELRSPPPSYSYLTAGEMRRRFPRARLFWILGRDQWEALPSWREPARLASLVEFIVFARDGAPVPRPGWDMHPLDAAQPASATAIRESVRQGTPRSDWLPPQVEDYIRGHRLYQG